MPLQPVIFGLDASLTISGSEAEIGVVLDADVSASNPDATGFSGGSLLISIAGATVDDELTVSDVDLISVSGVDVLYDGRVIGTLSDGSAGSDLSIVFSSGGVGEIEITALVRAISFSNNAGTPPTGARAVSFTLTDADADVITESIDLTIISTAPMIFETRVAASADDAEERGSGSMRLSSSDLELAFDGSKVQTTGIRFTGIDIPRGAIITNAYIQFQVDEVDSGAASLTIRGEDNGDAAAFTTAISDISSRTTTDASVAWTPADWITVGEAGLDQQTPDLAAIVQEIIDRGDWAALNDMALIITGTGTRTAEAFDGNATGAPLLHIEWYSGPNTAPVITSPAIVSMFENQTLAIDVAASDDADSEGAGLIYSITGGADQGQFLIDGLGVLSFVAAPDFEAPGDADANNDYQVQVTVTDSSGLTAVQDLTITVIDGITAPMIFETRVAASADDAEERGSGSMRLSSSDLELVFDGSNVQTTGIRFTGIDIPRGAIITNAYIQFQVDEVDSGAASLMIRGEDNGDAAAFTTANSDISSRTTTDASVAWTPADWITVGEAGLDQQTPDLGAIVQEIIDRGDWAALNDMALIITGTGTRTAEAFDGNATGAPLLHIEWYLPGSSGDPVFFNTPSDTDTAVNQIAELALVDSAVRITASATDPDAGDTVSYSVDDPRFAIDPTTGVITRSAIGALDFETEPLITLTVTATSSDYSFTTQAFDLAVLDDPEPVTFDTPKDDDPNADRIGESEAAGTNVGITASAADPDAGDTVSYSIDDPRFAIDPTTGVITRSDTGILDAVTEPTITLTVMANSSDGSIATETFGVAVTNDQLPTSVALVNTIDASQWSPPSPDTSGIAFISHLGTLLISDSEVNEIPTLFTGDNLFEMSLSGTLLGTLTTIGFSGEPTGVAYNPDNQHIFFSDDNRGRIYELNPGLDGLYDTSDDIVTSFKTGVYGNSDPEGLTYDSTRGVLYVADGVSAAIYTIDPGSNAIFDGVPSEGGDDIVSSFDVGALGVSDPEGIAYEPEFDFIYVIASQDSVAMVTTTGDLLGMLDISAANAVEAAGLALAPSSGTPDQASLYVVARGVDNDADPSENDGQVYEFELLFDEFLFV